MKKIVLLYKVFIPLLSFAAAGFADRRTDYLNYLDPSVKMISISTAVFFILFVFISCLYKSRLSLIFNKIIECLKERNFLATLVIGCLTSTILTVITFFFDIILWIFALFPILLILLVYPVVLSSRLRNKWLLNKKILWLQSITFISLVFSVNIFIFCVEFNILSVPPPLFLGNDRFSFTPMLHYPLDVLFQMFESIILYGLIVMLSLFLVGSGNIIRRLKNKLWQKQESYSFGKNDL